MEQPKKEIVKVRVNKRGQKLIDLPGWAWLALYKKSGIRSKKARHIKKAVKRMFNAALYKSLEDT